MPAIGLDVGASKAVMAALAEGEPRLIRNGGHSPLTPALLGLGPAGTLTWGRAALDAAESAVHMWLPRLGEAMLLPFNGLEYAPGELAALFFMCLRQEAEAGLGRPPGRVVLAAPLAFGQRQLALLCQAARRAGLFVLGVVPSTVAAALAYCWEHPDAEPRTLLICDFGASALGVAVVRTFPGAVTVLGQADDRWLGGEDFTQVIVAHLLRRLQGERGLLIDETQAARRALRRELRRAAEQAKVALSTVEQVRIALTPQALGLPVGLCELMSRPQFEEMAAPRLGEATGVVERALAAAGMSGESIDAVLLAGGAAQMPLWRAHLARRLGRARFLRDFNPLTGVAMGAALWAGLVDGVRCPTCGLQAPLQATQCGRCGSSLDGAGRLACPRCFLPHEPARLSCAKCGASLRAARRSAGQARPSGHAPGPRASWEGGGGLRCRHCGFVAPAGAPSCPLCGGLVAPFVGGLNRSDLGVPRDDGHMDVLLPRGQALPTPPAWRALATGVQPGPLEVPIYEGDKPLACQNERCGTLRVDLPAGVAPGSSVRVALRLGSDGLLQVGAELGDGSGRALDAWIDWAP